jgi:mono/diheme cytochrome c family protein
MADGEAFFVRSVQEGKIRVGIVHMPAWKEVLSMNEILDIRRYLENRKELIAASRAR